MKKKKLFENIALISFGIMFLVAIYIVITYANNPSLVIIADILTIIAVVGFVIWDIIYSNKGNEKKEII